MKPYAIKIDTDDTGTNLYRLTPEWVEWFWIFPRSWPQLPTPDCRMDYRTHFKARYATIKTREKSFFVFFALLRSDLERMHVRSDFAKPVHHMVIMRKKGSKQQGVLLELGYELITEEEAYRRWTKEQVVFSPYQNLSGEKKILKEES